MGGGGGEAGHARGAEGMGLGPKGQGGRQSTSEAMEGWGQLGWMMAARGGVQENKGDEGREKEKGLLEGG